MAQQHSNVASPVEPSLENWFVEQLLKQLSGQIDRHALEQHALECGAISAHGNARIRSLEQLFWLLSHYATAGSMRRTTGTAALAGIAHLTPPAFMHHLQASAPLLGWLLGMLLQDVRRRPPEMALRGLLDVRCLDATCIETPGAQRSLHRLHVMYSLSSAMLCQLVYDPQCPNAGEKLSHFELQPDVLYIADRMYCARRNFQLAAERGASLLVRYRRDMALYQRGPQGQWRRIKLFSLLRRCPRRMSCGELHLWLRADEDAPRVRIVFQRLSRSKAQRERDKMRRSKVRMTSEALCSSHFLVLVTNCSAQRLSARELLTLYRCRWQIELCFKRLKSVHGLDQLVCRQARSIVAWLSMKLLQLTVTQRALLDAVCASLSPKEKLDSMYQVQQQQWLVNQLLDTILRGLHAAALARALLHQLEALVLPRPDQRRRPRQTDCFVNVFAVAGFT